MKKYNFIIRELLVKEYSKNGKSITKIAEEVGCSSIVVRNRLIKYNIPIRTISEALKGNKNSYIDGRSSKQYYCNCGNKIEFYTFIIGSGNCKTCANKRRKQTKETKQKISLSKGGTGIPYEFNEYPEEFFKIRNKILERDNYICQKCSKYGNEVHHIDYDKQNNDPINLICLCHKCNMKANNNRNFWKQYFERKVNAYSLLS